MTVARVGWWSDAMNTVVGHELWLTPTGGMLCVTSTTRANVQIEATRRMYPDIRRIGEVHSFARRFAAGSRPLVPPPPPPSDQEQNGCKS